MARFSSFSLFPWSSSLPHHGLVGNTVQPRSTCILRNYVAIVMIGLVETAIPPNMDMDKSLEFGQNPECEQSLAHSLLIELLAYVQDLGKLTTRNDTD